MHWFREITTSWQRCLAIDVIKLKWITLKIYKWTYNWYIDLIIFYCLSVSTRIKLFQILNKMKNPATYLTLLTYLVHYFIHHLSVRNAKDAAIQQVRTGPIALLRHLFLSPIEEAWQRHQRRQSRQSRRLWCRRMRTEKSRFIRLTWSTGNPPRFKSKLDRRSLK